MAERRNAESIGGRRLAVGQKGLAGLAWLLGLDQAPPHAWPTAAAWIEDHVDISVPAGGGREVVFTLGRAAPGERAFVVSGDLALSYRAKTLPPALGAHIRAAAERRLAGRTLDSIAEMLTADPELGSAELPTPSTATPHPAHQLDTWGADDAWADFFARGEIARSQLDSVDPSKLFRFIQHCDNECLLVNPWGITPPVPLVEYPWIDRARSVGHPPRPRGGGDDAEAELGEMMTTELDEKDVILGNPGKVRSILERATSRPDPAKRIIFFSNTCVPTVTGEDVESVVREFQKRSEVPLLYLTVTPRAMNDVFRELLVGRRRRAEAAAGPPDPRAVNLIGFPDDHATAELTSLLERFGVRVNTRFLPELDVARLQALPRAALSVFRPNQVWAHYYEQLREESCTPHVAPTVPFGREGTRRWLGAVLSALGVAWDEAAFAEATAAAGAAWDAARARAAGRRLGLIVRGEELQFLTDPAHTWGVPLLELARDAGFGLDLMLHVRDAKSGRAQADDIGRAFEPGPGWTIHLFHTYEALQALLERTACEAVLTHYFFDWRLSHAGKNRFSLQHFEMGVAGGARTVARLAAACELPFYRRYRRFLRRTREGLRT